MHRLRRREAREAPFTVAQLRQRALRAKHEDYLVQIQRAGSGDPADSESNGHRFVLLTDAIGE